MAVTAKKYSQAPVREKLEQMGAWLKDKKARDLFILDLSGQGAFTEGMILVSATSIRHAQGLADHLLEEAGRANYEFLHMEGYQNGAWILLDLNDVIVNIFQKDARLLYKIEGLWAGLTPLCDERGEADEAENAWDD